MTAAVNMTALAAGAAPSYFVVSGRNGAGATLVIDLLLSTDAKSALRSARARDINADMRAGVYSDVSAVPASSPEGQALIAGYCALYGVSVETCYAEAARYEAQLAVATAQRRMRRRRRSVPRVKVQPESALSIGAAVQAAAAQPAPVAPAAPAIGAAGRFGSIPVAQLAPAGAPLTAGIVAQPAPQPTPTPAQPKRETVYAREGETPTPVQVANAALRDAVKPHLQYDSASRFAFFGSVNIGQCRDAEHALNRAVKLARHLRDSGRKIDRETIKAGAIELKYIVADAPAPLAAPVIDLAPAAAAPVASAPAAALVHQRPVERTSITPAEADDAPRKARKAAPKAKATTKRKAPKRASTKGAR